MKNFFCVLIWISILILVVIDPCYGGQLKNEQSTQIVAAYDTYDEVEPAIVTVGPITLFGHTVTLHSPIATCTQPEYYPNVSLGSRIMAWIKFSNIEAGTLEWRWIRPDGVKIASYTVNFPASPSCRWCYTSCQDITFPGQWRVEYYFQGQLIAEDTFNAFSSCTLTLKVLPSNAGVISGPGIDCVNDYKEDVAQYSNITLSFRANSGWKLLMWDDGELCYTSDSATITMNTSKNIQARFIPDSNAYSLVKIDASPIGKRAPLILIHGNNSETKFNYRWGKFINLARKDAQFMRMYGMYLFRWDSEKDDKYNGQALGTLYDTHPELINKSPVFLAHSRGGNISRWHMNDYEIGVGNFKGKLAGERVKRLFTLGTPFLGSPGADPTMVTFSIDNYFKKNRVDAKTLSTLYYDFVWKPKSHPFLALADSGNIISNDEICWNSSLMGKGYCAKLFQNTSLANLNKNDKYRFKITAFAGCKFINKPIVLIMKNVSGLILSEHRRLELSAALMAIVLNIPNGYYPGMVLSSKHPYQVSDGLVSMDSASYLKPGSENVFRYNSNGGIVYDIRVLGNYLQVKEVVALANVDHLDFLDNDPTIKKVIKKLKSIK